MLSMSIVITKYLNLFHIVMDDSDHNIRSRYGVCCRVRDMFVWVYPRAPAPNVYLR